MTTPPPVTPDPTAPRRAARGAAPSGAAETGTGRYDEPSLKAASAAGSHIGTDVLAYLLSGPLTFGLIGWGLDRWLGTSWIIAIGLVVGLVMSGYLVWLRYGRP